MEGKFRQADAFVSEDSKDAFYEAEKRRCRTFKIAKVSYSEEFTKASVVIECDTDVIIMPKGLMKVRMPMSSLWRLEGGQWMWYLVKQISRTSPFGAMKPGEGEVPIQIPTGPSVEQLKGSVRASQQKISFVAGKPGEGHVDITSSLPGSLKLELMPNHANDLKVTLDKTELESGQAARLSVVYSPDKQAPRPPDSFSELRIVASPVQAVLIVKLEFAR